MATDETSATPKNPLTDLHPDNATRLAIYDAMHDGTTVDGSSQELTEDQLFERVIPRLRVLVPRELHLEGESDYVAAKIRVCIDDGLLVSGKAPEGHELLRLSPAAPQIRLPDGELGDYWYGLEPARERIDRDNAALRAKSFRVREFIPSIKDQPDGPEFRDLEESMREHGFLRQFWIVQYPDGEIVDGLARVRVAEKLNLRIQTVSYPPGRESEAAKRRDTPLNRIALAINSNRARIDQGVIDRVHDEVSRVTDRPWEETAADLETTFEWRTVVPKDYTPMLDVEVLPFRKGEDPQVQVTADGRVMLRSIVVASGLSSYKTSKLEKYVAREMARTKLSSKKASFAKAEDIVPGIAAMKAAQAEKKNAKFEPQWDGISEWLQANVL